MQISADTDNQPLPSDLQPPPLNLQPHLLNTQPNHPNLQNHLPNLKPNPSSIQPNPTNLQTHPSRFQPTPASNLQPPQPSHNQPVSNPSDVLSRTETIISQQQQQIELLQAALQRSQQQLLQQQHMLRGEQDGLQVRQQQPSNGMKLLLAQQLQNRQLAAQIHHLQESQHKVQEEQVAVMTAMSRQHLQVGTNGAGKSSLQQNGNTSLRQNGITSLQHNGSIAAQQTVNVGVNGNNNSFQQGVSINNNSLIASRLNPEHQGSPVNYDVNQAQNINLELLKKVKNGPGVSLHVSQTNSMDDVLEILMKNGDLSFKPPPPPPLPVVKTTSSMDMKTTPTSSMDCLFPQLDLADMSFDFGQSAMPDLPPSIFGGSEVVESQGNIFDKVKMVEPQGITFDKVMSEGESMEVDQDVADWLDSLVVRPQTGGLVSNGTFSQSPGMILNGDSQIMFQNNLVEQGGNNWGKVTNFTQ